MHMLKPNSQCDGIWRWRPLGGVYIMRVESHEWNECPYNKRSRRAHLPFLPGEDTARWLSMSQEAVLRWPLTLVFLASRAARNKSLLFINHLINWYSVRALNRLSGLKHYESSREVFLVSRHVSSMWRQRNTVSFHLMNERTGCWELRSLDEQRLLPRLGLALTAPSARWTLPLTASWTSLPYSGLWANVAFAVRASLSVSPTSLVYFSLWHSLPSRILFHLFILSLSLSWLEWKPPAGRNFCLLCSMLCPQCPEQCLAPCRWSVDIWWLNEYEKLMLIDKQALRMSVQGTEDTTWQCNKASKCLWSTCRIYYH